MKPIMSILKMGSKYLRVLVVLAVLFSFQNCKDVTSSSLQASDLASKECTQNTSGTACLEAVSRGLSSQTAEPWLANPAFHSYYFTNKIISEVHSTGVSTYSVDTNLFGDETGFSYNIAVGFGLWTFTSARNATEPNDKILDTMEKILAVNPKAEFILRVYAGVPHWFKSAIPGELERYEDGCEYFGSSKDQNGQCSENVGGKTVVVSDPARLKASIFSKVLPNYWSMGLAELKKALVARGYDSKVTGIAITGLSSQEWIHFDAHFFDDPNDRPMIYSQAHQTAYRDWLVARYGVSKRGLKLPSMAEFRRVFFSNPGGSAFFDINDPVAWNVVHYSIFRSEATVNVITDLAKQVKAYFPGKKVGAVYGYMNEWGGNPGYGHNALGLLLKSPDIDFINPMPSYLDRAVGGADLERQPITSVKLHNKIVLNDIDFGTTVSKQNYDSLCDGYGWHVAQCHGTGYLDAMLSLGFRLNSAGTEAEVPSLFNDVHMFRRFLGFSIARDIRFSYLSLQNTTAPAGAEKSYLSDPYILQNVIPQINQAKRDSLKYDAGSVAQILVVSDEDSNAFVRLYNRQRHFQDRSQDVGGVGDQALYLSRLGLNKMGAPYDHVLMSDLSRVDASQYKLVIFLNAWKIDSSMRTLIEQKFKRDEKVIVWNYASGLFNESGQKSLAAVSSLVGMNISNGLQIKAPSIELYGSAFPLFSFNHLVVAPKTPADCCDTLYAADPAASILGTYVGSKHVSMAVRSFSNWKSIWTVTAHLPPAVFRDIAKFAGVHIYNRSDEPFYANKSFVTVVGSASGPRTLFFPRALKVYDAMTNQLVAQDVTSHTFTMSTGGVYIFRVE